MPERMDTANIPLVSVVMPAYNAGKYIAEAIESVRAQTFGGWELVIVDDGSTDGTWQIIQEYARKDPRIQAHRMGQNSGAAYLPRKKAVERAKGEWFVALDADDRIESRDLEKLLARQRATAADIVLQQLVGVAEDGQSPTGWECPATGFPFDAVLTGKEACSLTIGEWTINGNGLTCRRLYQEACLKQTAAIGMNSDEYFTRLLLLAAGKVAFSKARYFYRQNTQSISRKFSPKLFDTLRTDMDLKELVRQHYGEHSDEARRMAVQQWEGLLHYSLLLYETPDIPPATQEALEQRIFEAWKNIDWTAVKRHSKHRPFLRLLASNFSLYKAIVKGWIRAKRIKTAIIRPPRLRK